MWDLIRTPRQQSLCCWSLIRSYCYRSSWLSDNRSSICTLGYQIVCLSNRHSRYSFRRQRLSWNTRGAILTLHRHRFWLSTSRCKIWAFFYRNSRYSVVIPWSWIKGSYYNRRLREENVISCLRYGIYRRISLAERRSRYGMGSFGKTVLWNVG